MKWTEWTRCVRDHADLPEGPKFALLVLSTYADANGRCYPAMATLAGIMGVDRTTAQRLVHACIRLGWLLLEHQGRYRGDRNRYRITPQGCPHAEARKGGRGAALRSKQKGSKIDPLPAKQKGSKKRPKGLQKTPERAAPVLPEGAMNLPERRRVDAPTGSTSARRANSPSGTGANGAEDPRGTIVHRLLHRTPAGMPYEQVDAWRGFARRYMRSLTPGEQRHVRRVWLDDEGAHP